MLTEAFASRFHGFRLCFYIADACTKNSRSMNRSPDSCARYKASMRSLYNWHGLCSGVPGCQRRCLVSVLPRETSTLASSLGASP